MNRAVVRVLMLLMVMTIGSPIAAGSARQEADSPSSSAALVSGAYRIEVQQTSVVADPSSIGLDGSGDNTYVVSIVDVSNLGAPTVFDPAVVTVGSVTSSPLELATGTAADAVATVTASVHLKLSLDGSFAIAENSTIRIAIVFLIPKGTETGQFAMRVGDQVMSLENTMADAIDVASIPVLEPTMTLRVADITTVPGSDKISVAFRDGGAEDITLAGIDTPSQGYTGVQGVPGCFFNESAAAITSMSGGIVWLEEDPSGEGYLVWVNNAAMGTFDLMNGRLVQEGFAGVSESTKSPYKSWLSAATEWAKTQETGMWNTCKTAEGAWISQPTPAPEPTKSPDEIRAEYQWIDARDLLIRPGNFEGQKIALQGTVFHIEVEGNLTAIQMWVSGGDYDNVIVAYYGDSTGIYEGTWITVYGVGAGTVTGTNRFGGIITVPLVRAELLDW